MSSLYVNGLPSNVLEQRIIRVARMNQGKAIDPDEIEEFVMAGLAEKTQKTYKAEYEKFIKWKKELILDDLIKESDLLPLYLMTVAKDSKAKAAIITAAVAFFEKKKGLESYSSPYQNLVNKAISRRAPAVRHKEQITVSELLPFFDLANSLDKFESCTGTLVITLFSGFFRPMEALALLKTDLTFSDDNVKVSLSKSKRNQNGPPEKVYISRLKTENCPVKVIENWIKRYPQSQFVFPSFSGKERFWSYDAALKDLKRCLIKLKIEKNITLHSFRGSAATAAVEAGCTEAELDRGCRWKSSSSKKAYVQASAKSTANVSSILRDITI